MREPFRPRYRWLTGNIARRVGRFTWARFSHQRFRDAVNSDGLPSNSTTPMNQFAMVNPAAQHSSHRLTLATETLDYSTPECVKLCFFMTSASQLLTRSRFVMSKYRLERYTRTDTNTHICMRASNALLHHCAAKLMDSSDTWLFQNQMSTVLLLAQAQFQDQVPYLGEFIQPILLLNVPAHSRHMCSPFPIIL